MYFFSQTWGYLQTNKRYIVCISSIDDNPNQITGSSVLFLLQVHIRLNLIDKNVLTFVVPL
jgi:hypothetical protein